MLTPAWESKSHELLNVFGKGGSCEDQTCQSRASTGQALQESEEGGTMWGKENWMWSTEPGH